MGRAGWFSGGRVCESDLPGKKSAARQSKEIIVNTLKLIGLSVIHLVKQVCALPQTIANASKQRGRQAVLNELEAERLDRICNPSKYRGR